MRANYLEKPKQRAATEVIEEAPARADLRRQIAVLEFQLAQIFADAFPSVDLQLGDLTIPASGRPRILDLQDLELARDALAHRTSEARSRVARQRDREVEKRAVLQEMIAAPQDFKWVKISRAEVGEPGCGGWHSRPVLGLLGMLMGWWRIKISSGCP